MATLTADDIADLVAGTLKDLGRLNFQQIAQNLVHYEVFSKWFKKDKIAFDSGIGIQRTLMNRLATGTARHVGYLEADRVNIQNHLTTMSVPWRHLTTNWGLIYQTDILMNRGPSLITSVIKPRRAGAMIDMIEELERRAWAAPPTSSDKELPYGLPYWVVVNATTGFNGGAASGHTTVGGVDLTASPTFKNYTAQYAAVSKTDLIAKLRTAHRSIRFISPISSNDYTKGAGERYRLYVNETTIASIENVGESQNENLGRDIASMDGTMVFKKHPIIYVPTLDAVTTNPVYMIDHSTFTPVVLKGDFLRESAAKECPTNHNLYEIFVDLTYNYVCIDRRRNAVLATA